MTRTPDTRAPELLAPAGGPEALRAAVANGANAVYLGTTALNARRGVENFALEKLPEATRYAHIRGVKVYLAANVLVTAEEMPGALTMIDTAWAAGVDAVIVQDLGLLGMVRSELPEVRLHASTQLGAHNLATVRDLADAGVSRVTLARELSISEIAHLSAAGGVEIETFTHGALCLCYSGQCLMSSMIGGRSGNRGLCAQPCRLPYELIDEMGATLPAPGRYLLSPRDLCGIDALPGLLAAGVSALKIEGRAKSPEYVALVTGVYRKAIDRAVADPEGFRATDAERSVLEEAFSRGFSRAYLEGVRDDQMMSYTRPNNRGVPVGRVVALEGERVVVALERQLDAGDTVEFWTSSGRFAQKVGPMGFAGRAVSAAPAGEKVELSVERAVSRGDRVFRVANASLAQAARRTFAEGADAARVPVDVAVRLVEGSPLQVTLSDGDRSASAMGPVVERARTKPILAEEIIEHVGRFGGTPFSARSWDVELQPGVGIGYSTLHAVRREAVEALEARFLEPWNRRRTHGPSVPAFAVTRKPLSGEPAVVVWTADPAVARACVGEGADTVIVPVEILSRVRSRERLVIELPRIAHDAQVPTLLNAAAKQEVVVVGNLGLVREVASRGVSASGHWGLNVFNPWAAQLLADRGADFLWLSPELAGRQIAEIARHCAVPVGMAVYGRQEMMVTEHCVLMAEGPCELDCTSCPRRREWHMLRDAKGYAFPVTTDRLGRSHIFNSVPLDLSHALDEVVATGVAAVRLDMTMESPEEAVRILQHVRSGVRAASAGVAPNVRVIGHGTTGHFFRGVR
ncbi:MAG: DUF3656 domain-containing protein [Actinomycetota bacterium]|nr:DUF3656 domain-containing protein [Actinomycetota bacterium]